MPILEGQEAQQVNGHEFYRNQLSKLHQLRFWLEKSKAICSRNQVQSAINFKLLFLSMHIFGLRISKSFLLNLLFTFLWSYLDVSSPSHYIFTFTCTLLLDWVLSWHLYVSCLTHPMAVTEQDRVASFSAHWFLILQWLSCSFLEGFVAPLHFLHKLTAAAE